MEPLTVDLSVQPQPENIASAASAPESAADPQRPARPPWGGLPAGSPEAALFEALRPIRRQLAAADGYSAYIVLSDAHLADLCQLRPANFEVLAQVRGMGQVKLARYGRELLAAVRDNAAVLGLELREQVDPNQRRTPPDRGGAGRERRRTEAEAMFARGDSLGDLCVALQLAPATVVEHLLQWVLAQNRTTLVPWISDADLERVRAAAAVHGVDLLKPLWAALDGALHYPYLRLAQGLLQAQGAQADHTVGPAHAQS